MDIRKIISTVNRRLSNIDRYNNTPRIRNENVAEHSYYVAFYVMLLADLVPGINHARALELALVHDVEEAISGDIPHDVKMKYKDLEVALEKMNFLIASEIFDSTDSKYMKLWNESRGHETLESGLVHFCDKLSVYFYTRDEMAMGNTFMKVINDKVLVNLNVMLDEEPKFAKIREELKLWK